MPLVREGVKNKIKSKFFLVPSNKEFVSPTSPDHMAELQKLKKKYDIDLLDISQIGGYAGVTFFCEGDIVGKPNKNTPSPSFRYMGPKHIKVSIVCNYEFVMFYHNYIRNVDYVIFLNDFWAKHYNLISPKNVYLGSPKYDMEHFNWQQTPEERKNYLSHKYGLDLDQKYVLIIYPKDPKKHHKQNTKYPDKNFMLSVYEGIRRKGYKVIVKTRKQDPITDKELRGDHYLVDVDFYPCNSMELIELSHIVIYFSSSINEECVAMKRPYLDIKVDQVKDRFELLNYITYGNVWNINLFGVTESVTDRIVQLIVAYEKLHYPTQKKEELDNIKNQLFTTHYTKKNWESCQGASKRILDWASTLKK